MRVFRSSSARRRLVALTAVTALAAGTATALAPGAAADVAGWPATDGRIAVVNDGIMSMDVTGNDEKRVSGGSDDESPAWSPDGSRVVFESAGAVQTISVNGTTRTTVYDGTYSGASPSHPTYWTYGREIVYSAAKKLYSVPADGGTPVRLLSSGGCDSLPSGDATGKLLVFQRNGAGCTTATPSVVLYNATTKTQTTLAAGGGSPALSPDGTKVAFIRSVDGHGQLFSVNTDGTGERRLTNDTGDYDTLLGAREQPARRALQSAHQRRPSGEQRRHDDHRGRGDGGRALPMGRPLARLAAAAQEHRRPDLGRRRLRVQHRRVPLDLEHGRPERGRPDERLVRRAGLQGQPGVRADGPALAGKKHGPVLLTPATSVSSAVQAELKRVLKPGATVYLVGGTSILSSAVASKVTSLGFTPKRLAGTSRYSTSVAVAKSITSAPQYVFLATGTDYHSALAAASAAGSLGTGGKAVVVLNDGNSLTSSVKSYLNGLDPDTTYMIPVGASAKYAMTHTAFSNWPSTYTYYPVTASTNEGTAAALAKMWWYSPSSVALAYTDSWRGGTSAASAMNVFGPLLWTDLGTLSTETKSYLVRGAASINGVAVFGGTGSVSTTALNSAGAAVSASSTEWTYWPDYNGVPAATSSFSSTGPGAVSQPARTGAALRPTVEPNLAQLGTEAKQ